MSDNELPVYPATAPEVFSDPEATATMFRPVLSDLVAIVDVADDALGGPTPCAGFDVATLRRHMLAWLQFMGTALNDPGGQAERVDPETWDLAPGQDPGLIVAAAAADYERAIEAGVATELVTMSEARMPGDALLAMALGEYLIHGWDLATATGKPWPSAEPGPANDSAASAALAFLEGMVQPEHRGPESGFFDREVEVVAEASAFVRLLCFGGRQPTWSPANAA